MRHMVFTITKQLYSQAQASKKRIAFTIRRNSSIDNEGRIIMRQYQRQISLSIKRIPAFVILLVLTLSLPIARAQTFSSSDASPFDQCDKSSYYASVDLNVRSSVHQLLKSTHRFVVPHTSDNSADIWDALITIDSDPETHSKVKLIYSNTYMDAEPFNNENAWSDEHLWHNSHDQSGPDSTDLHALRPSNWNVNKARADRWFSRCAIAKPAENCLSPAHSNAALDTERDDDTFLPPKSVRGDVARALMYMATRYDGEEQGTLNHILADCPDSVTNGGVSIMGYLSQLLQWHEADPVDDNERARNDAVCGSWQGNRNPFIDHPELASRFFGAPKDPLGHNDGTGYDCSSFTIDTATNTDGEKITATSAPPKTEAPAINEPATEVTTKATTTTPTPPQTDALQSTIPSSLPNTEAPTNNGQSAEGTTTVSETTTTSPSILSDGACNGLRAGDVMISGFRSDDPDAVVLASLKNIYPGTALYLTDNAWTGRNEFESTEGVLKLVVSGDSEGLPPGYIFGYDKDVTSSLPLSSDWNSESGSFSLTATGDTIFLYCLENDQIVHLSALSYGGRGWEDPKDTGYDMSASSLPSTMPLNSIITLKHNENYRYQGARTGTRNQILESMSISSSWLGSDDMTFDVVETQTHFTISEVSSDMSSLTGSDVGTCGGLSAGDIMFTGFRSDSPDSVVLAALGDVLPGTTLYMTDNAWTGTDLKSDEGILKLHVSTDSQGIPSGFIFGWDYSPSSALPLSSDWEIESGTFSLSYSGETILLYCLDDGSPSSKVFITALSYNGLGWEKPDLDPSTFRYATSALPESLPPNAVITLPHLDNYRYDGMRVGSKVQLLHSISDPKTWVGSNSVSFDVMSSQSHLDVTSTPVEIPSTPEPAAKVDGCLGMVAGDIMISGFNTKDPDSVAMTALEDIPEGAQIYITNAAWTGDGFKDQEGVEKLVVPAGGIARGSLIGFGAKSHLVYSDAWESDSGPLLLTSGSDNIFVYCHDITGRTIFLSGLTYSSSGWADPNLNKSSYTSDVSALPQTLPPNIAITLPHRSNYVYVGPRTGTRRQILKAMNDPTRWEGENGARFDLAFTLSGLSLFP